MTELKQPIKYEPIDASPVKSFFVSMLTRDIKLEDAILDLLDNCVDGIIRSKKIEGNNPYYGYKAEIQLKKDFFSISDNCGGIPWDLHNYAFRMGRSSDRPKDASGSVGVYGIGMKRAIFKIGTNCLIKTQNENNQYEIKILPEWLNNESNWKLPVNKAEWSMNTDGTVIEIRELNEGVAQQFHEDIRNFAAELKRLISTNYAYIIDKGFEVKINGEIVEPRVIKLSFDKSEENGIRPYIFKTTVDGVEVFLAVGFTRPIPSQNEIDDEKESAKYSSIDAGWTILCNDRAVVYCDRSELTGWGDANVPRYHNQFIAISGIVEFRSEDPSKLPTTTTKRGIDASNKLYLQVKNKMREGMKLFTDYTNKWKSREAETKKQILKKPPLSLTEIKKEAQELNFSTITRTFPQGKQYNPKLPLPPQLEPTKRRISFVKESYKIKKVAEYFGDPEMEPSEVIDRCFETIYEEARK